VIDLLTERSNPLMIIEDANKGVIVPDLTEVVVSNCYELVSLILTGNSRRTMAPTGQNQFSSRSHAILQFTVEQRNKVRDTREEYLTSKFLIVDLAGSERGGLEKGIRTQEGANINKSLLSLGNCINILSDKSKKGAFVPYRDSKLTRLLKDSLGGNILTAMVACVSPSTLSYDETMNTLKYANRARTIQKKISKNVKEVDVHISQYKDIIDSLKGEIEQLKDIIKNQQVQLCANANSNEGNTSNRSLIRVASNNKLIDKDCIAKTLKEKDELMEMLNENGDLAPGKIDNKSSFVFNTCNVTRITKKTDANNIDFEMYKSFLLKNANTFDYEDIEKQVEK
jgi:kinesin family protein 18/19